MSSIASQLQRLRDHTQQVWGEELPPPASSEHVEQAVAWAREHLGAELPATLLEFWSLSEECGANGVLLYGPEQAWSWSEEMYCTRQLLAIQWDDSWLGWEPAANRWGAWDVGNFDEEPHATWPDHEAAFADSVDRALRLQPTRLRH